MILNCPLPLALTDISQPNCPFRFDQIVKLLFQRTTADPFATEATMQTLATWTALMTSTGDEKVVVSPIFTSFVIPASEALTVGGNDNTTFNGIREYYGEGSVTATGAFKNMDPVIKKQLMLLSQESLASSVGVSNLGVYFVNKDGYIFHNKLKGFPVYNFRISSVGSEGFNAPNLHQFSFDLAPDWDNDLDSVKPNFDPLTDLTGPAVPVTP